MLSLHHPGRDPDHNLPTRVCSRLRPCSRTCVPALPVQHVWAHSYLCGDYQVDIGFDQAVLVAELGHYRGDLYPCSWGVK